MTTNDNTNTGTSSSAPRDWYEERLEYRRRRHEARRRYPFHGLFPGMILILIGVFVMLDQFGIVTGDTWWQSFLIGLGSIFIISGLLRYRNTDYRWTSCGKFTTGSILIALGALFLLGISQWWPLVLIAVGFSCIVGFILRTNAHQTNQ
jgi:hypothetical protein